MDNPKVLICVPTCEMARRADFYDYYNALDKPVGTGCTFSHGQSPARNRNLMIQQALKHDFTHILFLDDDVVFQPDLLKRLLAHDVDLVTGLYLMRNFPHRPIIFKKTNEKGECYHQYLTEDMKGLIEIVACGLGACLIKTSVFKSMKQFELDRANGYENMWIRLGELEPDHWCDDIGFFQRVRQLGIKMYCDLDVLVGHMASVTLWPSKINGQWMTTYDSYGQGTLSTPAAAALIEQEN